MTNLHGHDQLFLGFDSILSALNNQKQTSFPPYNIIKNGDNAFSVELAVAGFKKEDITVDLNLNNKVLSISGVKSSSMDPESNYLHKGISTKSFTRTFSVSDTAEVTNASYENGILSVHLKNKPPAEAPVKRITIR